MRTIAIIVSAGQGKRIKSSIPKQYIEINSKPIIYYTLSKFNSFPFINEIIVVVSKDRVEYCRNIKEIYKFNKVVGIIEGGATRSHSVYNALKFLSCRCKDDIVLIHDVVRPFIEQKVVKSVISKAKRHGAALVAVTPKNTVKEMLNGFVRKTFIRQKLIEAQTPQGFIFDLIWRCYKQKRSVLNSFTDDCSIVESCGHKVAVVMGDYKNFKITTDDDLNYTESLFTSCKRSGILKTGIGYDIHQLRKNRKLVLGGVSIPSKYGLLGHSDADVLLHAITDAILGALGLRDIGWYFSNQNLKYKGINSNYFLLEAKKMVLRKGYRITNIDSVIIAQEPKLQPYYKKMVDNISRWLALDKTAVTVKFTTPENVGPLGAKEAIAGMAVLNIVKE